MDNNILIEIRNELRIANMLKILELMEEDRKGNINNLITNKEFRAYLMYFAEKEDMVLPTAQVNLEKESRDERN